MDAASGAAAGAAAGSIIPGIGTAVGAVGGALVGGLLNSRSTKKANEMSQASAREQMAFQERMSNTEMVRRKQDFLNAGINPLLGLTGGASSPSGASAQAQASQWDFGNPVEAALSSSREGKRLNLAELMQAQQLKGMALGNELTAAQTKKTNVEAAVTSRGIPEADFKNKMYDLVRPLVDRMSGASKSNAPKRDEQERWSDQQKIRYQKFHDDMEKLNKNSLGTNSMRLK